MNQKPTANTKILVAGFGALGKAMVNQAPSCNWISLNRAPDSETQNHIQADLLNIHELKNLPDVDYVIFTATPSQRSELEYKRTYVEAFGNLLERLPDSVIRVFFVSSTSVFGQNSGQVVNEHSDTLPAGFSGKAIIEGEKLLREYDFPYTIVRFGGIYGPGREMLIRQVLSGVDVQAAPPILTNRIHEYDCAAILLHLVGLDQSGNTIEPLYIAVDSNGADKLSVYQFIAKQLSRPENVHLIEQSSTVKGKRCLNKKLLNTGYTFHYPDYQSGYSQVIRERYV